MQNGTNNGSPAEIVDRALKNGELDKMLLSYPEYCFIDRFSCCPENSEISALLDSLAKREDYEEHRQELAQAIFSIIDLYEGVTPIAECLFSEAYNTFNNHKLLNLPLEEITLHLRKTIKRFQDRLIEDKTGRGMNHSNGRYGGLQGLSLVTEKNNGMPFCQ